jgi:hypothetical protein
MGAAFEGPVRTLEMQWLADKRLPQPGQNVILDAPELARFLLRHCSVEVLDGLTVRLRADEELPRMTTGTLVVLSQFGRRLRFDGAVMEVFDPHTLLVRLLPLPDQRAYPRFAVVLEISVASFGEPDTRPVSGVTLDLSNGGARVRTSAPVNIASRAVLSLRLPDGTSISGIVEPLDSTFAAQSADYATRFRFISMPTQDRKLLRSFLADMAPPDGAAAG